MFKKAERTERDIDQDVTLLADTLDEVLRESGDKTKEELKELHSKAKGVLRDARARFNGSTSLTQHARDAVDQADSYVRDKPWQGVGSVPPSASCSACCWPGVNTPAVIKIKQMCVWPAEIAGRLICVFKQLR